MRFQIPFTFAPPEVLKRRTKSFNHLISHKKRSGLETHLENCGVSLSREEYLSICISSFINTFVIFLALSGTLLYLAGIARFMVFSLGISFLVSLFVLFSQLIYPKVYSSRKERDIDRNLIPALEDILVQLNSGVPLFNIMVNISSADYGELSSEFKKAVKKINAGMQQIEVLEELGEKNSSLYFKRTLWQISNGLRAGSDTAIVIQDSIHALSEEQLIQIQNYGNKLNPLIMFYMLITVILPALSITFLTIIASMINLPQIASMLLFFGLFAFVVLVQIMFLGAIKSVRPSLL